MQRSVFVLAAIIAPIFASDAHADVAISSEPTSDMSCSAGICAPTATHAVLNAGDLQTMLASGSVTVKTTGSGVQANNLDVNAALTWSTANTLGLDAYQSITVNKAVSIAGAGGLSTTTNDGGANGYLLFGKKGNATFANLSGTLTENGKSFALVNSIASLAGAVAANPSGDYALAATYDASQDGKYESSPIPTTFEGVFEGLGNAISHFTVYHKHLRANIALFMELASTGTIENVRLQDLDMQIIGDKGGNIAGLVVTNEGILSGDSVTGSIVAKHCCSVGGLAAISEGASAIIVYGYANAKLVAREGGGEIAAGNSGLITLSHSEGSMKTTKGGGGGIVGSTDQGDVTESYSSASVSGKTGALVGGIAAIVDRGSAVENCYATGDLSGGDNAIVGGVVGSNDGAAYWSYSTGTVAGGHDAYVGGYLGQNFGAAFDGYWDTTTSGTDIGVGEGSDTGVTGLTTAQLQSGLPAGFDPTIWAEEPNINNGLPYLINNPPEK